MTSQKIAVNLESADSVQQFPLGALHIDEQGRFWEYIKANGALTAGAWVLIPNGNDSALLDTTGAGAIGQKAGICHFGFTDNYFGWVFRGNGDFEAVIENGHSAGAILTTTASAGVAGAGGVAFDGTRAIDAGVTATRVTIHAAGLLTVGVAASSD